MSTALDQRNHNNKAEQVRDPCEMSTLLDTNKVINANRKVWGPCVMSTVLDYGNLGNNKYTVWVPYVMSTALDKEQTNIIVWNPRTMSTLLDESVNRIIHCIHRLRPLQNGCSGKHVSYGHIKNRNLRCPRQITARQKGKRNMLKKSKPNIKEVESIVTWAQKNAKGDMKQLAEQSGFRQIAQLFPQKKGE